MKGFGLEERINEIREYINGWCGRGGLNAREGRGHRQVTREKGSEIRAISLLKVLLT